MSESLFPQKLRPWLAGVFILSLLYAVFSYSMTDPNLVLTGWSPYWNFQQWIWRQLFENRPLLTALYTLLAVGAGAGYLLGLKKISGLNQAEQKKLMAQPKKLLLAYLIAISPLFFSYNALSHDVFNYIFNAKMVLIYQANPHLSVALDYATDNWTRFMHNTHTPAPYGYGWTALSLVPFALGLGKFLTTWLSFRAFAVLSLLLLFWALQLLLKRVYQRSLTLSEFWLIFLNPLVLIEVVSNQHNDLWMMVPAMISLALVVGGSKKWSPPNPIGSLLLLGVSISIKLATVALVPIWLVILLKQRLGLLKKLSWELIFWAASVLMFLPLLTARSQQFLPWYLIWSLVWLPLVNQKPWKAWLIALSLTGLLRYLPWLAAGGFSTEVLEQQKLLLWGGGLVLFFIWLIGKHFRKYATITK